MSSTLPEHGTLIHYEQTGVYLIGASGSGKSEAALQLLYQGAVLICDDAPLLTLSSDGNELLGVCPDDFQGLIHIRDLGLINVGELLGQQAFASSCPIHLVIELHKTPDKIQDKQAIPVTLKTEYRFWHHKNWKIPGIRLHLYQERNVVVLIKTAIRHFSRQIRLREQPQ